MPISELSLADLPEAVVDRFAEGYGLIWTGAGVSRRQQIQSADGSPQTVGVLTGAALGAHLKHWTPPPLPYDASLESLATVYVNRLGRHRLERLIRTAYGTHAVHAPPFYARVKLLPAEVRTFVTTNYDPFLERALASRQPAVVVVEQGFDRVTGQRPTVYKVHGDADSPETCVITTPDYDRWERDTDHLQAKLATLFLEHTVVAVGYRAQDGNFRRLLGAVNARVLRRSEHPRRVYLVIPDAAAEDFAAYDVPEHDLVLVRATGEEFLDWLLDQLNQRHRAAEADALSQLVDLPTVRATRAAVRALNPSLPGFTPSTASSGQSGPQSSVWPGGPSIDVTWHPYAMALVAYADALRDARRFDEALGARADAARAFLLAGAADIARRTARAVYEEALLERHDAQLAAGLRSRLTLGLPGIVRIPMIEDEEIAFLEVYSTILSGRPNESSAAMSAWLQRTDLNSGDSNEEGAALTRSATADAQGSTGGTAESASAPAPSSATLLRRYRAARLRAEQAVTILDLPTAAFCFQLAGTQSLRDDQRADCLIRAYLCAGLHVATDQGEQLTAVRAALQTLDVPQQFERLRLRAEAWLLALEGDLPLSAERFELAGRQALTTPDPVSSASAYRSAEWVHRQRPDLLFLEEGPGTMAYRLEASVARHPKAVRATAHELLEDADEALRKGKTLEAWHAASAAHRMAYADIDPGNVHRARMTLAAVWTATLEEGRSEASDLSSLGSAIYFAALVHQELDDNSRQQRADVLKRSIQAYADPAERSQVLSNILSLPTSRPERVGVLTLLAGVASILTEREVGESVVPMIREGLKDGWGIARQTNVAGAACELLGKVILHVTPEAAAELRTDLTTLESKTPPRFRDAFYVALAQATDRASEPTDGGEQLAELLISTLATLRNLPRVRSPGYRQELGMALASLAQRARNDIATRVIAEIEEEARQGHRGGLSILAIRGAPVSTEALDTYLDEMATRVRSQSVAANPQQLIVFHADDPYLTQRAASDASRRSRDLAIDATIDLLGTDAQRETVRIPWISFAVRLARGTPERRPDVLAALTRLASGSFPSSGAPVMFTGHPLSAVRIHGMGTGPDDLQAKALEAIGALWQSASDAERLLIQGLLERGYASESHTVREGVVRGIGLALPEDSQARDMAWSAMTWQVRALVHALSDQIPELQNEARAALAGRTLKRPAE